MSDKLIVVVEDDPRSARLLRRLLPCYGYRVTSCDSGEAALAACVEEAPALVILDIQLPGMTGIETLRRMRADPRLAGTKYMAVTASARPHELQSAHSAGFDCVHAKPVDVDQLCGQVAALIDPPGTGG